MSKSYLVTGANSGIGLGFVSRLASRPNIKIYATARKPSEAADLRALAEKYGNISILQLHSDSQEESQAVAATIQKEVGHLDYVFANAGASTGSSLVKDTPTDNYLTDFKTNTLGPVILFQAIYKLLEASSAEHGGLFLATSTKVASIGDNPAIIKANAYGTSKAALNYVIKRISIEHPEVRALAIHPGLVKTRMGNALGDQLGLTDVSQIGGITVEESVAGVLKLFDEADKYPSGSFVNYDGTSIAW